MYMALSAKKTEFENYNFWGMIRYILVYNYSNVLETDKISIKEMMFTYTTASCCKNKTNSHGKKISYHIRMQ